MPLSPAVAKPDRSQPSHADPPGSVDRPLPHCTTLKAWNTLVATDSDDLFDDVDAAGRRPLRGRPVNSNAAVFGACVTPARPGCLDLQIGNMGGMATSLHLRNEAGGRRLAPQRILLLLDRGADVFLARESEADGWMIKPIDSFRLRRAADAVADGRSWCEHADGRVDEGEPAA
jgi:hypothetical protein